jgi:hypothetical protein
VLCGRDWRKHRSILIDFGQNQQGAVAMVDDRPDQTGASPDQDRPKRAPPTIDLEATEITSETKSAAGDAPPGPPPQPQSAPPDSSPAAAPVSPWIIAPVSGAAAAALVIAVGWMLGWPAVQPASAPVQLNAAAIDDLTARVLGLESKTSRPAADPVAAARLNALEKSLAATRAQSEKLAAALNDVRTSPGNGAAAPDLSAINQRLAAIESAVRSQAAEISQQAGKIGDGKVADARPADDVPLRRVVAASLLDVSVRHGDPYAAALAAARSLAENADALKPLDGFAASGLPKANALCRELAEIAPKLAPPAPESSTTGSGIVDRLQAGASKLVRIQRTDAAGGDRGSAAARVLAAALRNDLAEARRELKALPPADRAPAQAWLDKTDAREAALAASRKFAGEAMAALAPTSQQVRQ